MNLINVRDKYRQKIKFFESKDLLNESHIKVFIKGLSGMKIFIVDNNEMFEPIAIEWLDVYHTCRLKFDEQLYHKSVFYTSDSFFEILVHVPEHICANIFVARLQDFKMLATKVFDCAVYSHQVTFLEILFRFFNDYRNCKSEDEQQRTPDLISKELFPDIKNKDELIQIFLNINKSSYDTDSRNFLNELNRCVEPCKIFSIVAESIIINGNKLTAPISSNQSYKFWIDFNISLLELSFPCRGEEDQNGWVTNNIAKEDLDQLISGKNDAKLILSLYLKSNSNLNSIMTKFINSNSTKIDFKFVLSDETTFLIKNVLPYYQSYLQSTVENMLTPAKQQITKAKHFQKIITPKTIERVSKYDTIHEEGDAEEQQIREKIIKYANTTAMNSFTFEQSFSKGSTCTSFPINFNIFNDSIPKPVFQNANKLIESAKTEIEPVLKNITNNMIIKTPANVVKADYKRKKSTVTIVGKTAAQNKLSNNSDFDKVKSDGEPISYPKRKIYKKKQKLGEGLKGSQNPKDNIKQPKRNKPRKIKKLVNRVVPLQKDIVKKKTSLRNLDYNNSENLQSRTNVEIINSSIQNMEETSYSETAVNETTNVNSQVSLRTGNQYKRNKFPAVYDAVNINRVETRDEEFISNVLSQVRSQQTPSLSVQQTPQMTISTKSTNVNSQVPISEAFQNSGNKLPLVYDAININRVETRDEEFISNDISQVRSQQAPPLPVQQTPKMTVPITKADLTPVVHTSTPFEKINKTINNKNVSNSYRRFAKSKNTTTKLGHNSDIDCIEPYTESYLKESVQQPVCVQSFRQSRAKIKKHCKINSMDEEESPKIENLVVADVHSANLNNTFVTKVKVPRLIINLSGNQCNELRQIANVAVVHSPNTNSTSFKENSSLKLSNRVYNKLPTETTTVRNEVPNITITIDKQSGKQCLEKPTELNPKPVEPESCKVGPEKLDTPFVKQTAKANDKPQPVISIPMPILLEEIKTEYIISVDDDSDNENIDRIPEPQGNLQQNNFYSMSIQGGSKLIDQVSKRSSKRKRLEIAQEAEKSSEIVEQPKQKRTLVDHHLNAIVPINTTNNSILNNIQKVLMEKPSTNLDCNKRFSHGNELIRYSSDTEFPINRENNIEGMRQTINTITNIAQDNRHEDQLQNLINMFIHNLENKGIINEIQVELQNIKKDRLDKEHSMLLIVEEKEQKLCKKKTKIVQLLGTIKEQENVLKAAYTNLFKKIEKLTQSINKSRTEVSLEENQINQMKKAEYNLMQRLIETITDHNENIRDEIWRQFVIDLGLKIQQHFFDRYL